MIDVWYISKNRRMNTYSAASWIWSNWKPINLAISDLHLEYILHLTKELWTMTLLRAYREQVGGHPGTPVYMTNCFAPLKLDFLYCGPHSNCKQALLP